MRRMPSLLFVLMIFLPACERTEFEHLVDLPSQFVLTDFLYYIPSTLRVVGYFKSGSTNNGTACARVSGTIDWGDGIVENFPEITPCISTNKNLPNWSSTQDPGLGHTYPALGSYAFSATLTAYFTNGAVNASLKKTIDVDK